jgi:hypothetical protein
VDLLDVGIMVLSSSHIMVSTEKIVVELFQEGFGPHPSRSFIDRFGIVQYRSYVERTPEALYR